MGVSVTPREAGKIARANRVRLPRIGICVRLQNGSELCHDHRGYYIPGWQADYGSIAGLPDRHRSSNPRRRSRKRRTTRRRRNPSRFNYVAWRMADGHTMAGTVARDNGFGTVDVKRVDGGIVTIPKHRIHKATVNDVEKAISFYTKKRSNPRRKRRTRRR